VGAQAEQVMKNLGAILEQAGSSFGQVVKTTILLVSGQGAQRQMCPADPAERCPTHVAVATSR
jgi:enamine deaminase RidA (YjgF/YER057c/UK114 family)